MWREGGSDGMKGEGGMRGSDGGREGGSDGTEGEGGSDGGRE